MSGCFAQRRKGSPYRRSCSPRPICWSWRPGPSSGTGRQRFERRQQQRPSTTVAQRHLLRLLPRLRVPNAELHGTAQQQQRSGRLLRGSPIHCCATHLALLIAPHGQHQPRHQHINIIKAARHLSHRRQGRQGSRDCHYTRRPCCGGFLSLPFRCVATDHQFLGRRHCRCPFPGKSGYAPQLQVEAKGRRHGCARPQQVVQGFPAARGPQLQGN